MMRRAIALGVLLAGCMSVSDPGGPSADATLEVRGYSAAIESQFTVVLYAQWKDDRGVYPVSKPSWHSNAEGIASVNAAGVVQGGTPGVAEITATANGKTAAVNVEVVPLIHYTPTERSIFSFLALNSRETTLLRKWPGSIQIEVFGEATPEDRADVNTVAAELAQAFGTIPVSVVPSGGNVQLTFVSDALFSGTGADCLPPAGVWGFSCPTTDEGSRYIAARVWVSSTRAREFRRYLIRHELMHMAGFYNHPSGVSSILEKPEQITRDHYTALDLGLLEMMGRPEITAAMTGEQVMTFFSTALRKN